MAFFALTIVNFWVEGANHPKRLAAPSGLNTARRAGLVLDDQISPRSEKLVT